MRKEVTLQQIAQAAGVTRATVSMALRNHPRISVATRKKVQALAEQLGYRPNAELSRLMGLLRETRSTRDRPVMVLVTDYDKPLARGTGSRTWNGFKARADALGYIPEECWIHRDQLSPKRIVQILNTRAIRGVVFAALRDNTLPARMELSSFAVACVGSAIHQPLLHRSTSDKYLNTQLVCEQLWKQGCRRIALAVPKQQEERVEHTFLAGYLVFHHAHRHTGWRAPLVEESVWNPDRLVAWTKKQQPDGVVAAYAGLSSALAGRHGVPKKRCPRVACVHMNPDSPDMGVDQRDELIAAGAVDLVDAQLKRNETGIPDNAKTLLVRGVWHPGTR